MGGLIANVYKHRGASYANGGISGKADEVTVVGIDAPFEPTDDRPAVMLVKGNLAGTVKAVAAEAFEVNGIVQYREAKPKGSVGPMAGGCFIDTSDSRFGEAIAQILGDHSTPAAVYGPVALHDRYETPAQYEALSR
jgi:hypothetical protein